MKEWYIKFIQTILPLIVNQTEVSRETPFLYDLSSDSAVNTIAPSSPWPNTDFTVDSWNWTIQKTNGSSWQWEQSPGLWTTWHWKKLDGGIEYQGGGYRVIQEQDDEVWSELSWEQIGREALLWVCRIRKPQNNLETTDTVPRLVSEPWMKSSGKMSWGMRKSDDNYWMFCNDFACVDINYSSCNWKIQDLITENMEYQDFSDLPELEVMQNEVHLRTKRSPSSKRNRTVSFIADIFNDLMDFFFGSDGNGYFNDGAWNVTCGSELVERLRLFSDRLLAFFTGKKHNRNPTPSTERPSNAEELGDGSNDVPVDNWE